MRLTVAAVGRLKQGPERDLAERYRERAVKSGRTVGLVAIDVVEVAESRAREVHRRQIEESIALTQLIADGAASVLLDASGENLSSEKITAALQIWRDQGRAEVIFLIGGPDGVADALRERAELRLAFGAATWPHQLMRVMLLEQIYRAVTIMTRHPYHRA
jgi:23S rRNA (pseudouridine1915-N3)-methyltransferase